MTVITYREALNQALREEMHRDENVYLIGEDIGVFEGAYKVTQGLLAEFGEKRVRDAPIAEEGFVGAAIGSAMLGLRPVVELMTINFSIVAMDQIVNNAAKIFYMFGGQCPVPMVIRTPGGWRPAAHGPALAEPRSMVRQRARPEGGVPGVPSGRKRDAEIRYPAERPGDVH
ncbi:MAG: hypothetical protein KatS3mg060_1998 [Dehalococcoidia bacterium]|nr:MAG: hypothetical protein KatS3mg060_1998 [Dehalococcoidia bacterium]